ncbi:MAG: hypothetical protein JWN62_4414 [Acidimicrobiales bacterium]|nr:hypothetical protein [Acidimicrobiales bacterium]
MSDTAIRGVAKAMIHTFFRRVEVDGLELLPVSGPVITVANHANGLVDGLLLMSTLPRWPRFLGKATLFRIPGLKPLLGLAGVIPVHRAKDAKPGETDRAAQNDATFAECRRLLGQGAVVSIFPEGISHDLDTLQPLRTGAARIALSAAAEGATGISIVPIGLAYDAKATFRSHALVTIGDPIPVDQWADAYRSDERATVRACTDAMTEGLRAVSPDQTELPSPAAVTRRLRFATAVRSARDVSPRPALLLAAPIALIGAIVHAVPYQIVKRLARLPKDESIRSTVKLLGCTALFLVEWTGIAAYTARKRGPFVGLVALAAAPATGYVAVRFAETLRDATADQPAAVGRTRG